ncbi:MAG: Gfo/Idh/MocA family oxidoreductase [Dehalococcoidia bacterium]|nr:Gfo/Idh/MocA family oxidoreductase [Dehalococcoidia bacterium]
MKRVRVGLIGTGAITDLHYLGYKDNAKAELHAICDVDDDLLQRRVDEWDVDRAYNDYRELLDDSTVDAVEVITPHHLHAEIGIAALEAGKHVSLQKPMAISVQECDDLVSAAKASGMRFRVFENFMHYPPLMKAKELFDSGAIGNPLSIRIKVVQGSGGADWELPYRKLVWRFDPERGGGGRVIFDYGYHLFSMAMWFMGDVEKVYSWITHRPIQHGWIVDSPAVAMWRYKDGGHYGSFEAITSDDILVRSKHGRPEDEWIELTGSRGFIWVNRCTSQLLDRPPLVMYRDGETTEFTDIDSDWGTSFVNGVNDFAAGIIEGRQMHLTGEEGKKVFQLCKAIELSAAEGREVRPDEIV